jgi:hypothetical protein
MRFIRSRGEIGLNANIGLWALMTDVVEKYPKKAVESKFETNESKQMDFCICDLESMLLGMPSADIDGTRRSACR